MQWFRSNIRGASHITLFALVVQCVLSFGHSHAHWSAARLSPIARDSVTLPDSTNNKDRPASQSEAQQQQSASGQDGDEQNGDEQTGDNCAICAAIAMASTVVFATPPLLLAPPAIELLRSVADAEFVHLTSSATAFQPRAPPAS